MTEAIPVFPPLTGTDEPLRARPAAIPRRPMMRRWSDGLAPVHAQDPNAPWSMGEQWPALVATLSEQAVECSNLVLRALDYLVVAGRLRRAEARALSDTLQRLRDTSLRAQQITRLASGRIRQSKDRVALAEVVQGLVDERHDELAALGASVRVEPRPVDLLLDPPVAVSLVNTLLDWALTFSREIVLRVESPMWPSPARLVAVVTKPEPGGDAGSRARGRRLNDGLHWMLLRQIVASSELGIHRGDGNGQAIVTIDFPKTFVSSEGMASVELLGAGCGDSSAAITGWVLVLAGSAIVRESAVQALEGAGIEARAATDLEHARGLAAEGLPAAMVVAWDCQDEAFEAFRAECLGPDHRCPMVLVTEHAPSFQSLGFLAAEMPKVGQGSIRKELAPTVLFELAKLA